MYIYIYIYVYTHTLHIIHLPLQRPASCLSGGLQLLRTDHSDLHRPGGFGGQRVERPDGRPSLGPAAMGLGKSPFLMGLIGIIIGINGL